MAALRRYLHKDVHMFIADALRLRGYDAVQLAAAVVTTETMQMQNLPAPLFVAADSDLLTAAATENLAVENPLNHPEPASPIES